VSREEPTEEELRAAMEEQLRRVRVQDVLLQTVATLVNVAGRRLGLDPESGADERDLEQARLAIEGTRALLPLLSGEEAAAVRQALSQLQVAFAREAREGAGAAPEAPGAAEAPPGPAPPDDAPQPPGPKPADEAERAQARSRIWTPPGS